MLKRTLIIVSVVLLVAAIIIVKVPTVNNFVRGIFTKNQVSDTLDTTDTTDTTDGVETDTTEDPSEVTNPTEDDTTEDTQVPTEEPETEPAESEEVKASIPVYGDVEAYLNAIISNQYSAINLAPEKALVYDVRPDQFVNAEIPEYIEVLMMVNGEGKFTVLQEGFDLEEKVEYDLETLPVFKMCSEKEHVESWDEDMGPFHYHVVEGNEAFVGNMFTRNEGTIAKVILDAEAIEMLIAAGQYWYDGENAVTGIRVCGKFYEAPKPVVKPENYTVTVKVVDLNGKSIGIADKTFSVESGKTFTTDYKVGQTVKTLADKSTYVVSSISSNNGAKVTGNTTITVYCKYVAPVKVYATINILRVDNNGTAIGNTSSVKMEVGSRFYKNFDGETIEFNGKTYEFYSVSANNFVVTGDTVVFVYFREALSLSEDYPTGNNPVHTGSGTTENPKDENPLDDDRTTHPVEEEKKEEIPEEEYNHEKASEEAREELDERFPDRTDTVVTNNPNHNPKSGLTLEDTTVTGTTVEDEHSEVVPEATTEKAVDQNGLTLADTTVTDATAEDAHSEVVPEATAEKAVDQNGLTLAGTTEGAEVDDSEVASQKIQDELNAMFGGRE